MPINHLPVSSDKVQALVIQLEAIGDRLEDAGDPAWLQIAQAASLLEGIRLGITTIATEAPPENWFAPNFSRSDETLGRRHA